MTRGLVHTAALVAALSTAAAATDERFTVHQQRSTRQSLQLVGSGVPTLDVRTMNGSIHVFAYDGREVDMTVDTSFAADSDADLAEAQREVVLRTRENASTVEAFVWQRGDVACGDGQVNNQPWPRHYSVTFDFTIRVPRGIRLDLCTINRGDILVSGTTGAFDVRNVNGRITLEDMAASGNATTVNGGIRATFVTAPRAASSFKTINGDIVATFPASLAAELRLKTFHGGLFTDFQTEPVAATAVATRSRVDGRFVYRSHEFTAVRVGSGGPELTFDTLNGDVRVLKRN